MPLNQGLFQGQDQSERDLTQGPGWTIDDERPTFFENSLAAVPRGIGQGAADGLALLAHGLRFPQNLSPMEAVESGPAAASRAIAGEPQPHEPWMASTEAAAQDAEGAARQFSKSLIPDPRVTGTGANLIQGFSKAVTEFSAGSLAAGPTGGAALLGSTEGYAHYLDLLDQGVDEATARKSALLTGIANGAGAVLPMALPGKFLAGLSTTGTLLAQAGAGAVINTGFGLASRYEGAKILRDAGYPEMADQQEPWDALNIAVDALSGAFFGAHAGWHGLKAADIDPSVRDAAKVVQDRAATADRAPGVPVDMASAAIHRESLETALGDLLADRPVSLRGEDIEGATFARGEEDSSEALAIMHEEFTKSGVLDSAGQFDRWLAGEEEPKRPEQTIEPPAAEATADQHPDAEIVTNLAREAQEEGGSVVSEQTPSYLSPRALTDRPDLKIVGEDMAELYHGSPHVFDALSLDHVGTGEGAQVYGHGIYLAENPNVGEAYKKSTTAHYINEDNPRGSALRTLEGLNGDVAAATTEWRHRAETATNPTFKAHAEATAKFLESGEADRARGNLYKILVSTKDRDRMLDWDKPLSEQKLPAAVREKIADIKSNDPQFAHSLGDSATGEDLHMVLQHTMGAVRAAKWLKENGVPGLRYLDSESRGGESATRNMVLFDDKAAHVVQRNDDPINAKAALNLAKESEKSANAEAEPMFHAAVDCEARHA